MTPEPNDLHDRRCSRQHDAAATISKTLREEWAAHLAQPRARRIPTARVHAGYLLTTSEPLTNWSRENPGSDPFDVDVFDYWSDVKAWILRALGQLARILEPWRTDREADAILAAAAAEGAVTV